MSTTYWTEIDSPLGALWLTADDTAVTGLFLEPPDALAAATAEWVRADARFTAAQEQIEAYFAGELRDFELPVRLVGTPFQVTVWEALRSIPYGDTRSYREIAEQIGRPTAARAVGMANGRNPVSIIVPCHRVIGTSGELTGYGWGLDRKRALLDLERGRAVLATDPPSGVDVRAAGLQQQSDGIVHPILGGVHDADQVLHRV